MDKTQHLPLEDPEKLIVGGVEGELTLRLKTQHELIVGFEGEGVTQD
jgi:hypothetical protein